MKNVVIITVSFLLFTAGCDMDLSLSGLDFSIRQPYCIGGSLYPLYTKDCTISDANLTGKWCADSNMVLQITQSEKEGKKYQMTFYEDSSDTQKTIGCFDARLVKLQNRLFIDMTPSKFPSDINEPNKIDYPMNAVFFAPVHIFLVVDSIAPEMRLRFFDSDGLNEIIEEKPNVIKHEFIMLDDEEKENILITAGPKQLQEFIVKYADDERLFPDTDFPLKKCSHSCDKKAEFPQ